MKVAEGTNLTWQEGNIVMALIHARHGGIDEPVISRRVDGAVVVTGKAARYRNRGGVDWLPVVKIVDPNHNAAVTCAGSTRGLWDSGRCGAKPKYFEPSADVSWDGSMTDIGQFPLGWCGTHAPSRVAAKRAEKHRVEAEARASRKEYEDRHSAKTHEMGEKVKTALAEDAEATEAFRWLLKNAKYGYSLETALYPKEAQ